MTIFVESTQKSFIVLQISEKMHLKAIEIKESILGKDNPEVALSLGHLASLYTYQLKKFKDAELLFLRSKKICKLNYNIV